MSHPETRSVSGDEQDRSRHHKPALEWRFLRECKNWGPLVEKQAVPGSLVDADCLARPMRAASIAKLDTVMEQAAWMLDVVLLQLPPETSSIRMTRSQFALQPTMRSTYLRWFGTDTYLPSAAFILRQVRKLVAAYLVRGTPDWDLDITSPSEILFLDMLKPEGFHGPTTTCEKGLNHAQEARTADDEEEDIGIRDSRMTLFPNCWDKDYSLLDFHTLRLEPTYNQNHEVAAFESVTLTVIHELIHLASFYCYDSFLAASGLQPSEVPEELDPEEHCITDVGTGLNDCLGIPLETNGDLAALLNADSYAQLVAQVVFEYLGGVFQDHYLNDSRSQAATREWATLIATHASDVKAEFDCKDKAGQEDPDGEEGDKKSEGTRVRRLCIAEPLRRFLSTETSEWSTEMRSGMERLIAQPPSKNIKLVKQWWREPECERETSERVGRRQ